MSNLFKSLFSGKKESPEEELQKNNRKNFEIFKYDGLRAVRMHRIDYARKCFVKALELEDDFETMNYLSQLYMQTGETEQARELLQRMAEREPQSVATLLNLANACYQLGDYAGTQQAASRAIAVEEGNAAAYFLLAKACNGENNDLMTIAHLTKAIVLKDDFEEARIMRAEALLKLHLGM